MSNLGSVFKESASVEDEVKVDISYDIIRQFSAQLYTNPRKAIEELVCNSYDAGASECHIKLPKDKEDSLVVLDNGESMGVDGLKDLWMVAKSPKQPNKEGFRVGNKRMQIGKFGVGKLAAYALGKRLTHVATLKGITRVVSVAEDEIKEHGDGKAPRFEIFRMKESEAHLLLDQFLGYLPRPWDRGWTNWTMAVVEEIEETNFARALKVGLLRRMISTALPVHKDFRVFLEGAEVPGNHIDKQDIEISINVLDPAFRDKLELDLQEYWRQELQLKNLEDVSPSFYKVTTAQTHDPHNVEKSVRAILVPKLGPVSGVAILAKSTLTSAKLEERGYSNNGFAIYSYGKLVNPEDELFGISPRSHAYWRRFLARVEVPGLDDVLLVQRNAVSENSPKAQIAREVLRTLFNYTRSQASEKEEAKEFKPQSFGSKLRTLSPLLASLAVEGLGKGVLPKGGMASVDIDFVTLGEDGPPAIYDTQDNRIQINQDHPIIAAIDDLREEDQKLWRRVIGEIVAGGKLVEGLLAAKGVDAEIVDEIGELTDAALSSAARFIHDPVEEHIKEIVEASYVGGSRFENAVVNAFRSLRLVSRRLGGPDKPDGYVEIPVTGGKNLRISIEAKGTDGIITHKELSEATVARHEKDYGCTSSVAIAREYQTTGKGGQDSGLIKETAGKLPLLTVPAIALILRLHKQRPFTYDKVEKILTKWTRPDKLEDFILETWQELPALGLMKLILQVAHDKAEEHDQNYPDPGMLVGDPRLAKRGITKDHIKHVLEAIAVTTGMVIIRNRDYEFSVAAPVDTILEAMTAAAKEQPEAPATAYKTKKVPSGIISPKKK